MKVIHPERWKRILRRLINSHTRGATILLYHRVAQLRSDPWGLCVSPENFAEHLQVLNRLQRPVLALGELERRLQEGPLPRGAVVLTFDDGYADNLHSAYPLLARYEFPATIFIATGNIGIQREFWWDELERVLLEPGDLPSTLSLNVNGHHYQWSLEHDAHYSKNDSHQHEAWTVGQKIPTRRHLLYCALWELMSRLGDREKEATLNKLAHWGNLPRSSRPTHRSLTSDELLGFAAKDHVEIGAHTVSHPMLGSLLPGKQNEEIMNSKIFLEDLLKQPVQSFSYPHGNSGPATASLVQKANFRCACSTVADIVHPNSDPYQLPRVEVKNWSGPEFEKRLSRGFLSF